MNKYDKVVKKVTDDVGQSTVPLLVGLLMEKHYPDVVRMREAFTKQGWDVSNIRNTASMGNVVVLFAHIENEIMPFSTNALDKLYTTFYHPCSTIEYCFSRLRGKNKDNRYTVFNMDAGRYMRVEQTYGIL